MPIFRSNMEPPSWCELRGFEIIRLSKGEEHVFHRESPKEKLIVGSGNCLISVGERRIQAEKGANLDLTNDSDYFSVLNAIDETVLVRMHGEWGEELGGSGLFQVAKAESVTDKGDPVEYTKETRFDNHYHDCDEYWIILEGTGVAVTEGKHYNVGPGDCIATGMGHHHDFPLVSEPVKAVYFETTLEGKKRRGHLWNHTHGQAEPKEERV